MNIHNIYIGYLYKNKRLMEVIKMDEKGALLDEHKEHVKHSRNSNSKMWGWVSFILAVLLLIVLIAQGVPDFGMTKNAKANDAIDYLNSDVLSGFATAELDSVTENNGMYVMAVTLTSTAGETQDTTIYLSEDGELMFPTVIQINGETIDATDTTTDTTETYEIDTTGQPFIGNEDAKVTIIEFSDFQCPYCEKGYTTMKEVLANYPDDVKIVFMNFPLSFHDNAQKAAEASECAFAQGKFEEYHNMLFENQGALSVDDLKQYAVDLGLDTNEFNTCLDDGEMTDEVESDTAIGSANGVTGTPAFFINGEKIVGARPYADFETAIEEALAS